MEETLKRMKAMIDGTEAILQIEDEQLQARIKGAFDVMTDLCIKASLSTSQATEIIEALHTYISILVWHFGGRVQMSGEDRRKFENRCKAAGGFPKYYNDVPDDEAKDRLDLKLRWPDEEKEHVTDGQG